MISLLILQVNIDISPPTLPGAHPSRNNLIGRPFSNSKYPLKFPMLAIMESLLSAQSTENLGRFHKINMQR